MKPLFALVIIAAVLSACSKKVDESTESLSFETSSDVSGLPYVNCKLRYIVHEDAVWAPRVANGLFTYYHHGNPYSLTYPDPGAGFNASYYFQYDSKKRLKELYVDDMVPLRHTYGYDNNDRIIIDTLFNATGISDEGVYTFVPRMFSVFTYDNKGRIVREVVTEFSDGEIFADYTYSYDTRGNLVVPGSNYVYDNKISIFRSHPVFQFLHRNYSMNNPIQSKYNSKGLPLTLAPSNDPFFNAYQTNPGGGLLGGISKVIYDCN